MILTMFIYGLKSLTDIAYQLVQDSYNKTAEYAKSIFEAINSAACSTRSLRIHSVVVLTWAVSLSLPVAEALYQTNITDQCCSPGFFARVLFSTCKLFNQSYTNITVNLNTHIYPFAYEVTCGKCFVSAEYLVLFNGGIKQMNWLEETPQKGTFNITFYPNIPTVNILTNCTLPFTRVTLEGTPDKFLAIIREFPHLDK